MGKKTSTESEESRLKKKIATKRTGESTPEAKSATRSLLKRLKREQRRRRALALRKKHAAGSKGVAAPASA
jgi:hypothetical protein